MTRGSLQKGWSGGRLWVAGATLVFALALLLSWQAQQRTRTLLEHVDAQTLDESGRVLDAVVVQQRKLLTATVGVLSDDSRIRAMVLTPSFDRATVLDLLTDLRATSGASVAALLDGSGVVRAVVGAPEMDQLDLGTSALVREAMERPAARLWAFANRVGVLSAAPVRLDQDVHALFMLGFALEDSVLREIQQALGTTGAIFVGEQLIASASRAPELEGAMRAAAELPRGEHRIVGERFLGSSAPLSDSAVAARVAWLLPVEQSTGAASPGVWFSWLPALLVGLMLALMIGLERSQSRGSGA